MKAISAVSLHVKDYDEAINWYCEKLEFVVLCDEKVNDNFRFVRISPSVDSPISIVLAKTPDSEKGIIGKQATGVLLFLNTDNFWADYHSMLDKGVTFMEQPREEVYATVVVFSDLYGNQWDLLQPK
jgi:uncharacterized glyoxalase superfamily protein PhnB